jgi:hypothetical protein
MYDFLLQINSKSFYSPFKENDFFERRDAESIEAKECWFILNGLTINRNRYYYSDSNNLIWIYGNIFLREGYQDNYSLNLTADYVLNDLINLHDIHIKYKGNYCIFRIDKNTREFQIVNSQLGTCHVYYYNNSNMLIVSNNLNHFKHMDLRYNNTSIYQKMMFTYELNDTTSFIGVKRLRPGEIISFKNNSINNSIGSSIKNLFEPVRFEKFDVEKYISLFNSSVKEKALCDDNVNVSFTGGFDGRTIVSSLLNQGISANAYSFGKFNGENTRIPLAISKKIGINYNPVYLEEDYEKSYVNDAKKVIYFSDGMSFNERANYVFAFRKLAEKSRYVLSGLIGGETLRPVHLRTDYLNENYYQLFYLNNPDLIDSYFQSKLVKESINYFDYNAVSELKEIVSEKQSEISNFRKKENGFLYYLYDLMQTGFRMYYGTEIHFERQYCNNLTPFYDIDLLQYLLSTDYVEIFKQAFKPGKVHRWSGQKIYARIIEKNFGILNKYSVDRGYPPGYLLNPLKLVLIPYLYYKRKNNRKHFIDFDENKWSKLFLEDFIVSDYKNELVFNQTALKERAVSNLKTGTHSSELNRILSLQTWFNQ